MKKHLKSLVWVFCLLVWALVIIAGVAPTYADGPVTVTWSLTANCIDWSVGDAKGQLCILNPAGMVWESNQQKGLLPAFPVQVQRNGNRMFPPQRNFLVIVDSNSKTSHVMTLDELREVVRGIENRERIGATLSTTPVFWDQASSQTTTTTYAGGGNWNWVGYESGVLQVKGSVQLYNAADSRLFEFLVRPMCPFMCTAP